MHAAIPERGNQASMDGNTLGGSSSRSLTVESTGLREDIIRPESLGRQDGESRHGPCRMQGLFECADAVDWLASIALCAGSERSHRR